MFIDSVKLNITAGTGGNGIVAVRREKYVEFGGPAGGSGGRGADVVLIADEGLRTLLDFTYNRKYKAEDGQRGMNKNKNGHNADKLVLKVPVGTAVYDDTTGELIADLVFHNDTFVVCKGGRGGRGNFALAKAGKHSLEICENGEPGEEREVRFELKLLADVGLVGLPSVGKSTLISVISKVKPKIAAYHFTTLSPNLGVVKTNDNRSFTVADLPGLIEGAALGKGLGTQFLKHIERTKIILHIVDMGSAEGRDPIEDYRVINNELTTYGFDLDKRKQIVVANKCDLPDFEYHLEEFKKAYPEVEVIAISSLTKNGLEGLLLKVADELDHAEKTIQVVNQPIHKVYEFKEAIIQIEHIEEHVFLIKGEEIEKLVQMTSFTSFDNMRRFSNQLKSKGIYEMLEEQGIQQGDYVRILDFEFEYEH
jgi:GTP-binding protein